MNATKALLEAIDAGIDQPQRDDAAADGRQTFIDALPAAVWAKDANGRHLFVNSGYNSFFDLPPDTVMAGRYDYEFFDAEDVKLFRAKDRAVMASGECEQFQESVHLRSGTKHVLTLKFPLRRADGSPYATCGMCFDITESVLHREGLEQTNSQLTLREEQLLALSRSPAIDAGDLPASLALIAAAAAVGLEVNRVGIWLWDEHREVLRCMHLRDGRKGVQPADSLQIRRRDYPLYFAALDEERSIAADEADTDPRTAELTPRYLRVNGIHSMLATPIRLAGVMAGVLSCEHTGSARNWSEQEESFSAALADTIGRTLVAERRQVADASLRELNYQLEARVAQETREARRAEAEAKAARQLLKDITDQMPGAASKLLWHAPGQFELLYITEGIEDMTGVASAEFINALPTVMQIILPEDRPGLIAGIDAAAQPPGQAFEYTFRIRNARTGALHWIQNQARSSANPGGGVVFYGAFTDVSTRKRLEDAVTESERLLKAAMSASSDGIWEWKIATDEVFFSPRWFEMLGYPANHLPGRLETFSMLVHPDDLQQVFTAVAQTIESTGRSDYQSEFRMRCADGSWCWVLGRGTVSERDAEGRALRLTGTNTNIHAHKVLESSLADATTQAQSASKAKGDFLANMSHEIRTPMNAVIGLAKLLGDTPLNPQQQSYLDKLQSSSSTLLALINDVLDLSKIEAGKLKVERTPFSLANALKNLHAVTEPQANARGLFLVFDLPDDLPEVLLGDPLRLGQVLLNLVGNAIKFTESGEVRLVVSPHLSTDDGVLLHFAVHDTGIGIDPERATQLFQPFEQADSSTSRRFGGTGLGLAICHQLVELMGGEMGVKSTPGVGSTFWFTAHCEKAAAGSVLPQPRAPLADTKVLSGLRVLVAEDNDINLEILTELLARVGVEVRSARDGGEAIAGCASGWPQLVLMDMQMPDIDGLAATTMLRKDARFAALPIIALTANAMTEDRARCLAAGMNDHLAKPIDVEELYTMLARWRTH